MADRIENRRTGFDLGTEAGTRSEDGATYGLLVYILYGVGLITAIPTIAAVIVSYVLRSGAEPWLQTHHTFIIRTFWVQLLLTLIGTFLMWTVIFWIIGAPLVGIVWIWALVRMIKGGLLISARKPVGHPESWAAG